ncbi:MAG: glycogen/starch synthase [Erysipelotrichaceae bacterium]
MNIAIITTTANPFNKYSNIGDNIKAFSTELNINNKVTIIIPLYKGIKHYKQYNLNKVCDHIFNINDVRHILTLYEYKQEGIIYYLIQNDTIFKHHTFNGYKDDYNRFIYYQYAVLEVLNNYIKDIDVVHLIDSQCLAIPAINTYEYPNISYKYILSIHKLEDTNIYISKDIYIHSKLRIHNYLLNYINDIVVVSKGLKEDIDNDKYGIEFKEILNDNNYKAILNGINTIIWNPINDKLIESNYSYIDYKDNKLINKLALQKNLGLNINSDIMLICINDNITWQKGICLILENIIELSLLPVQFVILGNGERELIEMIEEFEFINKGKVAFYCGYNDELAHLLYAASDLLLQPSIYEADGHVARIAQCYGCLPLVHYSGGLKDSVNFNNGFIFKEYTNESFMHTLHHSIYKYYNDKVTWDKMIRIAMSNDISFKIPTLLYEKIYEKEDKNT